MAEATTLSELSPTATKVSRAALRPIEAGSYVDCARCSERVKFQAKIRLMQVICNVYTEGRWTRVEHYHEACYIEADLPYGEPS
jgi:hypothetical protein